MQRFLSCGRKHGRVFVTSTVHDSYLESRDEASALWKSGKPSENARFYKAYNQNEDEFGEVLIRYAQGKQDVEAYTKYFGHNLIEEKKFDLSKLDLICAQAKVKLHIMIDAKFEGTYCHPLIAELNSRGFGKTANRYANLIAQYPKA